jgi:formylglycine-generating enzyme required for sulfatase activity
MKTKTNVQPVRFPGIAALFAVNPPVTVKAIAVKEGMANSGILTAAYILTSGGAMVWVPGGTFTMGSPASEPGRCSNETQHEVTLSSGFYMGAYQVTQEEYQGVMGSNPSTFTTAVSGESDTPGKLPVERVSWYNAIVFCNKLSIAEGLSPAYSIDGSTDPVAWGTVPTSSNAAWDAAGVGTIRRGMCVQPIGTASTRTPGTTASASGCSALRGKKLLVVSR